MDGYKILVIEDFSENADLVKRVLGSAGWTVDTCISGEKAIQMVTDAYSDKAYDCILMDICMPGQDGIDTARQIMEAYHDRNPVIVACTSMDMQPILSAAISSNILKGYLAKPINVDLLAKTLVGYINK